MKSENLFLENELLETAAGQAVYDALVQANIDLRSVSVDLVKDMLQFECRRRRSGETGRYLPRVEAAG
ncbi:MAG: hypothetical protein ACK5TG_11045 [Planctomyces sp.]|jgi:uncharacterized protein (DUF4213/DUF364 family)|nr:hypothetical protein [Planctomyces sp.]GDX90812.1 hypothetical protein LBMAG46_08170 [Planctomycetia bacterium]HAV34278.1 hypothetical protein [Planctomycetaceae bacterium]HBC64356.1 hypothetical protein [Planctomycetaceae bacterium]